MMHTDRTLKAEHLSDRITSANDREARDTLFVVLYLLYQHLSLYLPERRSWHKSISTPSQYEGNNYIC